MESDSPPGASGAQLDEALRVVDQGRVVCCIGTIATFYFLNGNDAGVRARVCQALDRYHEAIGRRLAWGADPFTLDPRPVAGSDVDRPRVWMHQLPTTETLNVMLHGGAGADDADPFRVIVAARARRRPTALSYFSIGVSFQWIETNPPGAFRQLVVDLSEILAPSSGYAGLAAVGHVDVGSSDPDLEHILPFIYRFEGLELDIPTSHPIYMEKEDRIKGINWLTVLDQRWIDRLGGKDTLQQALGPGVEWHSYSTGAVIQAGPRPLFGDRNRQEPMPHYRQVAKALKPIRLSSILGVASQFGFDRERAEQWTTRFD